METVSRQTWNRADSAGIAAQSRERPAPALLDITGKNLTGYAETGESTGAAGALGIPPIVLHQIFAVLDGGLGRELAKLVITLLMENVNRLEDEIPIATFLLSVTVQYPKHFRDNRRAGALVAAGLLYRVDQALLRESGLEAVVSIIDKDPPDFASSAFRAGKLLAPMVKMTSDRQAQALLRILHQLVIMEEKGEITKTFLQHLIRDSLGKDWRLIPGEDLTEAKQAISHFLRK